MVSFASIPSYTEAFAWMEGIHFFDEFYRVWRARVWTESRDELTEGFGLREKEGNDHAICVQRADYASGRPALPGRMCTPRGRCFRSPAGIALCDMYPQQGLSLPLQRIDPFYSESSEVCGEVGSLYQPSHGERAVGDCLRLDLHRKPRGSTRCLSAPNQAVRVRPRHNGSVRRAGLRHLSLERARNGIQSPRIWTGR